VSAVEVDVPPVRCAFPRRCVGICGVVVPSADPADRRDGRVAGEEVDPARVAGADPSTRGPSWWSELMHLTSVGGQGNASRGEEAGPM
jgi:hypothetical protein